MDQDRELFKLQVAAQHYESTLQMSVSYLEAFYLAMLVLSVDAAVAEQVPWLGALFIWAVCLILVLLRVRSHFKDYKRGMRSLGGHLRNLETGQTAPSLEVLIGE